MHYRIALKILIGKLLLHGSCQFSYTAVQDGSHIILTLPVRYSDYFIGDVSVSSASINDQHNTISTCVVVVLLIRATTTTSVTTTFLLCILYIADSWLSVSGYVC